MNGHSLRGAGSLLEFPRWRDSNGSVVEFTALVRIMNDSRQGDGSLVEFTALAQVGIASPLANGLATEPSRLARVRRMRAVRGRDHSLLLSIRRAGAGHEGSS